MRTSSVSRSSPADRLDKNIGEQLMRLYLIASRRLHGYLVARWLYHGCQQGLVSRAASAPHVV